MYDLLFALLCAGAFSLFLSAAWIVFTIFLYIVYKLDGGRLGLISYLKKY